MMYDDTVERLAKAVASQIDSADKYKEVMDKLESIRGTNMYTITMENFVRQYTNPLIVMEYESKVTDEFIDQIIEEDDIDFTMKMTRNKRKRIPVKLRIINIFKRRAV